MPQNKLKGLSSNSKKLSPNFVTGLVDAEGSFRISIYKNRKLKTGFRVTPLFQIGLHNKIEPS